MPRNEGSAPFDLDAYLNRIGYQGERAPTLNTLSEIHLRHAETIPFENLDPFLKQPVHLDPAALQRKLVQEGRGGYCYEHNLLLSHALTELGFNVTGLAARVLWNAPEDAVRPRSHMLLQVNVGPDSYLADVGFGGLTLTSPLRLQTDVEQATPHEAFRLRRTGQDFLMEARLGGDWKPLYRFDLQTQLLPDYEMANWYVSHHPNSLFVTGLMIARPDRDRRYSLQNRKFSVHSLDGGAGHTILNTPSELRRTLEHTFRINLSKLPGLDSALERWWPS